MKYDIDTYGKRWHDMHCGGIGIRTKTHFKRNKSIRSEQIAAYEGVPVETVRPVLRQYREKMWG